MKELQRRKYTVENKVTESELITSFYLRPMDGEPLPNFRPGQFLTLELDVPGQANRVIRNYSVSNWPQADGSGLLRITIKREGPPPSDDALPAGVGSNFLHDHIHQGSSIDAIGPFGQFFLKTEEPRPVVLLSGGVGITPMVSMAHYLSTGTDREVYFIHACDSGDMQAFAEEMSALCARHSHISQHICYRYPKEGEELGKDYHSEGILSKAALKSVLPLDVYEFYLCGPPPFMQAMYSTLLELGVDEVRINYEFFGPASLLKPKSSELACDGTAKQVSGGTVEPVVEGNGPRVTFTKSDVSHLWDDQFDNLLDFAEAKGIEADFSCRVGICNECKCTIREGTVAYTSEPLDEPGNGELLPCCARPVADIEIEL